jgi:hypothetical protein
MHSGDPNSYEEPKHNGELGAMLVEEYQTCRAASEPPLLAAASAYAVEITESGQPGYLRSGGILSTKGTAGSAWAPQAADVHLLPLPSGGADVLIYRPPVRNQRGVVTQPEAWERRVAPMNAAPYIVVGTFERAKSAARQTLANQATDCASSFATANVNPRLRDKVTERPCGATAEQLNARGQRCICIALQQLAHPGGLGVVGRLDVLRVLVPSSSSFFARAEAVFNPPPPPQQQQQLLQQQQQLLLHGTDAVVNSGDPNGNDGLLVQQDRRISDNRNGA